MNPCQILCLALSPALVAQSAAAPRTTGMTPAILAGWIAGAAPGSEHQSLRRYTGSWTFHQRDWWIPGGAPWNEVDGTCEAQVVTGGRYVKEELHSALQGHPYEAVSYLGFDKGTSRFLSTWMDNFGTSVFVAEGEWDAGTKTYHMEGRMHGSEPALRILDHWIDEDHHTYEMWAPAADGTYFRMVEMAFTRRHA